MHTQQCYPMPSPMTNPPASNLSFEEWGSLDGQEELVNGQLVEEEMPSFLHEMIVSYLITLFRTWLGPGRGAVGASGGKFRVSPQRGRIPDLFVYLPDSQFPATTAAVIDVPPHIMLEVVSERARDQRRDRVEKVAEYASFGARYYWLVDASLRSVQILELGPDGRYTHAVDKTEGLIDPVPGCPGLQVDVDALWTELDRFDSTS